MLTGQVLEDTGCSSWTLLVLTMEEGRVGRRRKFVTPWKIAAHEVGDGGAEDRVELLAAAASSSTALSPRFVFDFFYDDVFCVPKMCSFQENSKMCSFLQHALKYVFSLQARRGRISGRRVIEEKYMCSSLLHV